MGLTAVRTLIVDDYEPWRRFLRLTFLADEQLLIIGEAIDGLEAVQKGRELQPDVIILDIGLPAMNGIEAARILREVSPKSKIVFVSENRSPEILQEALRIGASGFVLKFDAGRELLPAVRAVLEGRQYVSSSLIGLDGGMPNRARPATSSVRMSVENSELPHHHEVIFYFDDRVLLDRVTLFVGNALKGGNAAVVLATESHREIVLSGLQGFGIDIPSIIEQGRYLSFDAEEALSTFMLHGVLDQVRLSNLLRNLIATASGRARGQHSRVSIFGECAHLLWANGSPEAAIQMERLGNELIRKQDVNILCGYSLAQGRMHPEIRQLVCEQHSAIHTL
jgi:DNA-binding NarL/FixJ family response regulator